MIIKVSPLAPFSSGPSDGQVSSVEYTIPLDMAQTISVPDSASQMISVILDMPEAIADCHVILPEAKKGRRITFYFVHTATQFVFTGSEPDSIVSNGELSVDKGNLIIFYCVSESQKLWARDAQM